MKINLDNLKLEKKIVLNGKIAMIIIGEENPIYEQGQSLGVMTQERVSQSLDNIHAIEYYLYSNEIKQSNTVMNINYIVSDDEIKIKEIVQENLINMCGDIEISSDIRYCDMTGNYEHTYEEFFIDGFNFEEMLDKNIGKYAYLELEIYNREDTSSKLKLDKDRYKDLSLAKELIFNGKIINSRIPKNKNMHNADALRIVIMEESEKTGFLNKKIIKKENTVLIYEIEKAVEDAKKMYENIVLNINYTIKDNKIDPNDISTNAIKNVSGLVNVGYSEYAYPNGKEIFRVEEVDFINIINNRIDSYIHLEISVFGVRKNCVGCGCKYRQCAKGCN